MVLQVSNSILSLARLINPSSTLINKTSVANAWLGSYKIRNPTEFLDTFPKPKRWPRYNEIIQPPQLDPKEERRPATYYHYRENIKHSPKKMWYVCKFVRGMNVDEAIKQLRFLTYKSAKVTAEVLEEAQAIAVKDHNFEYKSNMWIEEALCGKGLVIKGFKKHARMRFGKVTYFHVHLMIKLREGEAPQDFYRPATDGNDHLKKYYENLRSRKIDQGL